MRIWTVLRLFACLSLTLALYTPLAAQEEKSKQKILFTNVDVFDGFNEDLIKDANVLVEGNVITAESTDSIDAPDAFVVDATGKTMTPGLIDMHTHIVFMTPEGTNSYQDEWDGRDAH